MDYSLWLCPGRNKEGQNSNSGSRGWLRFIGHLHERLVDCPPLLQGGREKRLKEARGSTDSWWKEEVFSQATELKVTVLESYWQRGWTLSVSLGKRNKIRECFGYKFMSSWKGLFNSSLSLAARCKSTNNLQFACVRKKKLLLDFAACLEKFQKFLDGKGIDHKVAVSQEAWNRGVCVKVNKELQKGMNAQLLSSHLPHEYWAESLASYLHVWLRKVSTELGCSPFEKLFNRKPSVAYFKVFGSHVRTEAPGGVKNARGIFVGYEKGLYRVILSESGQVILTKFLESAPKIYDKLTAYVKEKRLQWDAYNSIGLRMCVADCSVCGNIGSEGAELQRRGSQAEGGVSNQQQSNLAQCRAWELAIRHHKQGRLRGSVRGKPQVLFLRVHRTRDMEGEGAAAATCNICAMFVILPENKQQYTCTCGLEQREITFLLQLTNERSIFKYSVLRARSKFVPVRVRGQTTRQYFVKNCFSKIEIELHCILLPSCCNQFQNDGTCEIHVTNESHSEIKSLKRRAASAGIFRSMFWLEMLHLRENSKHF
ncbi:Retrovirus-related Pol polyprotein from transposon TNT 1-94 [Podarcis lilfordi]|nr:Retrovirus-related Pol polyprotein from transposon TNT 1-94 [Podarcis lilfordi]